MPDKKLTPMMELIEWAKTPATNLKDNKSIMQKMEELLEKERQMVIDAAVFMATPIAGEVDEEYKKNVITVAEQYYEKTYKS